MNTTIGKIVTLILMPSVIAISITGMTRTDSNIVINIVFVFFIIAALFMIWLGVFYKPK